MGNLTLYREFYCINHTSFSSDVYNLITPVGISANTYISGSTTIIETPSINNESVGKYFVSLNPILYSFDYVYELKWTVMYNVNSPIKILTTRFRMKPYNITSPFDVEINSSPYGIELELLNNSIDIEL
jgi:hypothetical protein